MLTGLPTPSTKIKTELDFYQPVFYHLIRTKSIVWYAPCWSYIEIKCSERKVPCFPNIDIHYSID